MDKIRRIGIMAVCPNLEAFWLEPLYQQARKPQSYPSSKLCPVSDRLTGVEWRATSVAKKQGISHSDHVT